MHTETCTVPNCDKSISTRCRAGESVFACHFNSLCANYQASKEILKYLCAHMCVWA